MRIEESFTIQAPRDRVSEFLLDVDRVSKCVPGVSDLRMTDDGTYAARLRVQLGPIHANFQGQVAIDEDAAPERISARGEGRDSGTGSVAQVDFAAHLVEMPDGTTRVESASEVTLRGRLGQFGTGVVQATATIMLREFAECAARAIEATNGTDPQPAEVPSAGRILRHGLLTYFRGVLVRLRSILRRSPGTDHEKNGGAE